MINYQELKSKFKATLDSFSTEMLSSWIEFDQERDTVSKLLEGEVVNIKYTTLSMMPLTDVNDKVFLSTNSELPKFAMAA